MIMIVEAATLGYNVALTSLPSITREFPTNQPGWILTAFILTGTVASALAGKLADLYGKRRIMVICLLISLAGAVTTTLAPSLGVLFAGRALQGAVMPMLFLTYSLMRDVYPRSILPVATAVSLTGIGVISICVPFLAGWLIDSFGWRGLFAFDVVWIAVFTPILLLTTRESPVRARSKVDVIGGALLAFGLVVLLYGVSSSRAFGWGSTRTLLLLALGVVLLAGFAVRSLTYSAPIVDLRIFGRRGLVLAAITASCAYGAAALSGLMAPLLAMTPRQTGGDYGLGFTAGEFAYVNAPLSLAMVVFGFITGKLMNRYGAAALMKAGLAAMALSGLQYMFFHDTYVQLLIAAILMGVGQGLSFGSIPGIVIASAPADQQGSLAAMVQVTYGAIVGILPIVLFSILTGYITSSGPAGVVYSSAGFRTGGLLIVAVTVVGLLLASTVLRTRRSDTTLSPDDSKLSISQPARKGVQIEITPIPVSDAAVATGRMDRG
jgi:MFS family permease